MKNFKKWIGVWLFIIGVLILPSRVNATELNDVYNSVVTNDTITFKSIAPTSPEEFDFYSNDTMQKIYNKYSSEYIYVNLTECNENYTKCKLTIDYQPDGENLPIDTLEKEISVVWQDAIKSVKSQITEYSKKLEALQGKSEWGYNNPYYFEVEDLNLINYYINAGTADLSDEVVQNTLKYSQKLRDFFDGANLTFAIDFRAGSMYSPFETEAFGGLIIKYQDVVYAFHDAVGLKLKEIIYVPSDTDLTDEALMAAATKRIKEYMPNASIQITPSTLFSDYKNVDDEDVDFSFIDTTKTNGKVYKFDFGNFTTDFVIVADSSKIKTPEFVTKDLNTNVEISSTVSSIPLDTLVNASILNSGDVYNKIIKLLEVEENETYDITLYSALIGKNITKLDNGQFEVKIPISEELKDKNLTVYYVDENDKVIEYEVKVKDGYAVFVTDHFSVYTLAQSIEKESVEKEEEKVTNNPKTGDNTYLYVGIFTLSVIGLAYTGVCLHKKNK